MNTQMCLFCDKSEPTLKDLLKHMRNSHSFFIKYISCVVDIKGLIQNLRSIIEEDYLCIHCGKFFPQGPASARQHMISAGHCFMPKGQVEYTILNKYYDFTERMMAIILNEEQECRKSLTDSFQICSESDSFSLISDHPEDISFELIQDIPDYEIRYHLLQDLLKQIKAMREYLPDGSMKINGKIIKHRLYCRRKNLQ